MYKNNHHLSSARWRRTTSLALTLAVATLLSPLTAVGSAAADELRTDAADDTGEAVAGPTAGELQRVHVGNLDSVGLYTAIAPTRVFDTRDNDGTLVGVPTRRLNAGEELRVNFYNLPGVNPDDDLLAVALNLTVTNATQNGHVSAYPCGQNTSTSSVNVQPGKTFANAAIVSVLPPPGSGLAGGEVCFRASISLDLMVDFSGYFSVTSNPNAGGYIVSDARLFDTREANAGFGVASGKKGSGEVIELDLNGFGDDGPEPMAVEVRLTSVQSEGNGYAVAYPCASGAPNSSTVNFSTSEAMTNSVIVPVDRNRKVCVKVVGGPTHLLMDSSGYYAENRGGFRFLALQTPRRALDTRAGFPSDIGRSAPIFGSRTTHVLLADLGYYDSFTPRAVAANVTTVNAYGPGHLRAWAAGYFQTRTSMNNYPGGPQGRASAAILPLGYYEGEYGFVSFFTPTTTDMIIDVFGFYIDADNPTD